MCNRGVSCGYICKKGGARAKKGEQSSFFLAKVVGNSAKSITFAPALKAKMGKSYTASSL